MTELTVQNRNGILLMDSREVAEMVEKEHNKLLRDIRQYCEYLGVSTFGQSDFFLVSTYKDAQNKEQPSYLITRKGCDMIANKLTGRKGVLFTAAYVSKFEAMEKKLASPALPNDLTKALEAYIAEEVKKQIGTLKTTPAKPGLPTESLAKARVFRDGQPATIKPIAEAYGISGQKMNTMLREYGVLFKKGVGWYLCATYADKGYGKSKTVSFKQNDGTRIEKHYVQWTPEGKEFIYNLLKDNGILPVIERNGKSV